MTILSLVYDGLQIAALQVVTWRPWSPCHFKFKGIINIPRLLYIFLLS